MGLVELGAGDGLPGHGGQFGFTIDETVVTLDANQHERRHDQ
ncbi:Uncharacterised protein [Bordetella pertussis]|nr:Uncharacterised protein [Bordetella pertussis]